MKVQSGGCGELQDCGGGGGPIGTTATRRCLAAFGFWYEGCTKVLKVLGAEVAVQSVTKQFII